MLANFLGVLPILTPPLCALVTKLILTLGSLPLPFQGLDVLSFILPVPGFFLSLQFKTRCHLFQEVPPITKSNLLLSSLPQHSHFIVHYFVLFSSATYQYLK
jgi:hypothetical protein